jgi:hypothetical protein
MGSRSPRRPSLEPAWQPGTFRRLQPRPDFQSVKNLPALAGGLQLRDLRVLRGQLFVFFVAVSSQAPDQKL